MHRFDLNIGYEKYVYIFEVYSTLQLYIISPESSQINASYKYVILYKFTVDFDFTFMWKICCILIWKSKYQ